MKRQLVSGARRAAELRTDSAVLARLTHLFPELTEDELLEAASGGGLTLSHGSAEPAGTTEVGEGRHRYLRA